MENNTLLSETGIIITLVLIIIPVIAALLIVIYKIYGIVSGLVRKRELEKFNEYLKGLGIRKINFTVRNGPAIAVEGLREKEVVDGIIPLMINAYDKGNQKKFITEGSETPQSIPSWLWILFIAFAGWAAYYTLTNFTL